MNLLGTLASFLPPQTFVILLVAAGVALIVGARRVAAMLAMVVGAGIFLPVVLEPVLDSLPLWLLILGSLLAGMVMLRAICDAMIGKNATDHAVGSLVAHAVRAILTLPLRILAWCLRAMFGRR